MLDAGAPYRRTNDGLDEFRGGCRCMWWGGDADDMAGHPVLRADVTQGNHQGRPYRGFVRRGHSDTPRPLRASVRPPVWLYGHVLACMLDGDGDKAPHSQARAI